MTLFIWVRIFTSEIDNHNLKSNRKVILPEIDSYININIAHCHFLCNLLKIEIHEEILRSIINYSTKSNVPLKLQQN